MGKMKHCFFIAMKIPHYKFVTVVFALQNLRGGTNVDTNDRPHLKL